MADPPSPSGFSDQMDDDGRFIEGTEIFNDYTGYKDSQKAAEEAGNKYQDEATKRNRQDTPSSTGEVPTPFNRKITSGDLNKLGGKRFYKEDHAVLLELADEASEAFWKHSEDRRRFNVKYAAVWRKRGTTKGHEEEVTTMENTAENFVVKADVHEMWSRK